MTAAFLRWRRRYAGQRRGEVDEVDEVDEVTKWKSSDLSRGLPAEAWLMSEHSRVAPAVHPTTARLPHGDAYSTGYPPADGRHGGSEGARASLRWHTKKRPHTPMTPRRRRQPSLLTRVGSGEDVHNQHSLKRTSRRSLPTAARGHGVHTTHQGTPPHGGRYFRGAHQGVCASRQEGLGWSTDVLPWHIKM